MLCEAKACEDGKIGAPLCGLWGLMRPPHLGREVEEASKDVSVEEGSVGSLKGFLLSSSVPEGDSEQS